MGDHPDELGLLTCRPPHLANGLDRSAFPMEHPPTDMAGAAFDFAGIGSLFFENLGEGRDGREGKRPTFAVLSLTGIQADLPPVEIDVLPFTAEDFIASPSRPIHEHDDGTDPLG